MTLTKVILSERDMPTHWYNINADLPAAGIELPPVLHPGTASPSARPIWRRCSPWR